MSPRFRDEGQPEPPHSDDAEAAVISAMLNDPDIAIPSVRSILKSEDFYNAKHRFVFRAIVSLAERRQRPDLVTLTEFLRTQDKKRDWLDAIGGATFITELMRLVVSPYNVMNHAEIVRDHATRRKIIDAGAAILQLGYNDAIEPVELAAQARKSLEDASQRAFTAGYIGMAAAMENAERRFAAGDEIPLSTGYPSLDEAIYGFQRGELVTIGGRPGLGKSALAIGMAWRLARDGGQGVAIISLEMSREQIIDRLIGFEANQSMFILKRRLRSAHEHIRDGAWQTITQAQGPVSNIPLWIDDSPDDSLDGVISRIRTIYANEAPSLFILDYLQLMRGTGRDDNRVIEVGRFSRALKMIARELNVVIVALSQLNRAVETRPDKKPTLADLRDSGAIEQDSDKVLLLYRDSYYTHDDSDQRAEIDIAKNRNGPGNIAVTVEWNPSLILYRDPKWNDGVRQSAVQTGYGEAAG